ncbi:dienelactone hydrolase family protein [soil metagenome]|jgi:dienelactone hydrolase
MGAQTTEPVKIPADGVVLDADLTLVEPSRGMVVFAHGSGSGRHSSRNRQVAAALHAAGLGTLLMDLLTAEEDAADARTAEHRFDIPLLARRLIAAAEWVRDRHAQPVGYFGASTGGGAALLAAAERPELVATVVSRGGRPDLAGPALASVAAPALLIVGALDEHVLELNRRALEQLPGEKRLEVVPGATHLFAEPGALERVAELAVEEFTSRLRRPAPAQVWRTRRRSVPLMT